MESGTIKTEAEAEEKDVKTPSKSVSATAHAIRRRLIAAQRGKPVNMGCKPLAA